MPLGAEHNAEAEGGDAPSQLRALGLVLHPPFFRSEVYLGLYLAKERSRTPGPEVPANRPVP
jgi:hypothetical protein